MASAGREEQKTVDLRNGFRIEVEPVTLFNVKKRATRGTYGARLYERVDDGERTRWRKVKIGPMVNDEGPEAAARDLLRAMNEGLLPGVEVKG